MSVRIKGLNKLVSNWYDAIMIRQKGENYIVDIKGKEIKVGIIKSYGNNGGYRQCADKERISNIIKNYLSYSKISSITEFVNLPRHSNTFAVVRGNRNLYLGVPKIPEETKDEILNKYLNDRLSYCYSDDREVDMYSFSTSFRKTSYETTIENHEECMKFTLLMHPNNLAPFERDFVKKFIGDKLASSGMEAKYVWEHNYCSDTGTLFLTCGGVRIKIEHRYKDLLDCVNEVVSAYTDTRNNIKKKQLKMEGF